MAHNDDTLRRNDRKEAKLWVLLVHRIAFPPRRIGMNETSVNTLNFHPHLLDARTTTGLEPFPATALSIFDSMVQDDDKPPEIGSCNGAYSSQNLPCSRATTRKRGIAGKNY